VHVAPSDNSWSVCQTGATRAYRVFKTKEEAVTFAVDRYPARGHEVVVHDEAGYVVDKYLAKA